MSGKFFLDTNLIVYTFDKHAHEKRSIAQDLLIQALHTQQGCISWQVIQEFINVARHKFVSPLSAPDCELYLQTVLNPICTIYPDTALYQKALAISHRWQYRFFDALIISAALKAECHTLYTEDLQHQQKIESVHIINPFTSKAFT
jgi:predicted nucleic acid-binding protein